MEIKEFYVKYLTNGPVGLKTHTFVTTTGLWVQTVFTVGDLVAAYKTAVAPLLDQSSIAQLTLHLPDTMTRSASGLGEDCFANVDETDTTFRTGLALTRLNGFGFDDLQPLIIKSNKNQGEGAFIDTEQSSSSMQQIEVNKTKIRKLEETFSNFIQKAETIHISKLNVEKLENDGFTLIATSVPSINDLDAQIPEKFHKFEWPVKNNEKDIRNKKAYLEYLSEFTQQYNQLQVKSSIESPNLNTVVGIDPHNLNGDADLYVMPDDCHLLNRTQLSMVFEMKPNKINSNNLAEAIGYVIAANSLFDVPGRPSPVGVLSDFIDQWYLIWIGKEGEVFHAAKEEDSFGNRKRLTRLTALYYIQKHLENYDRLLKEEKSKKSRAENYGWAFDGFEAGSLKKQKILVAEDNMRDLLETDEEVALYDMRKRMLNTPSLQIPPPAKEFSDFS